MRTHDWSHPTKPCCLEWLGDEDTGDFCLAPPAGLKLVGLPEKRPIYIFVCEDHGPELPMPVLTGNAWPVPVLS